MSNPLTKTTPLIFHFRRHDKPAKGSAITVVYDPVTRGFGTAVCGKKDSFCKKRGIEIATGRAKRRPSILFNAGNSINGNNSNVVTFDDVKNTAMSLARELDKIYHLKLSFPQTGDDT